MLKLYNTLTRRKEDFKPVHKDRVRMYTCGPTVYNNAHIGNLRTNILYDIIKRVLVFLGYKVEHVMNITDVDDKTIRASIKEGVSLKEFTRKYEKIFLEDLKELNIIKPNHIPRATEYINEMIKFIEGLIEKGYAYKTSDGIYFSIEKSKNYGELAGLDKITKTKERIKSDEYDKENPSDFALWKFYTEMDGENFWDAPFGKGRPGWHIECSVMSTHILGDTIDIHSGAVDLIFPHHTNEIAQSEALTGKQFVKYWVHGGFLTMKEGKMSKSLGNIYALKDIKDKGYSVMDYRYMCLTTHYRSPLQFTFENLESAKNSYERLKNIISEIKDDGKTNKEYLDDFELAISDDFDMPKALQVLWTLIRDEKAAGKIKTIKKMDSVFGLKLLEKDKIEIPDEIKVLIKERENARNVRDWKKADEIRDKIRKMGYIIEDKDDGIKLKKA